MPNAKKKGYSAKDLREVSDNPEWTKKNGTAPERNRIRRRLREVVRLTDSMALRPHHDYVLVGRRAALSRDFTAMVDDFQNCLQRLGRAPKRDARKTGSNDET